MAALNLSLFLPSDDDTQRLGQNLARLLTGGDCVALRGQIGAGKSALARSIIRAQIGEDTDVPSPTFTLVQTYDAPIGEIWHADLYRLSDTTEAIELGLLDAMEGQICLIEWPEVLGDLLPRTALDIHLAPEGDGRIATMTGDEAWSNRLSGLRHGS